MSTEVYVSYQLKFNGQTINHIEPAVLQEDGTAKNHHGIHTEFKVVSEQDYQDDIDAMFTDMRKMARNRRKYI